jgi:NADPH-dependent 2,4-dienoyl-CoA reductase/sulfur reductase-like enzyme/nitrite reductase/ring-hydroxylating ferredoxin subunit
MSQSDKPPPGPDLGLGIPRSSVPASGVLAGHVGGEAVLLSRLDDGIFAVGGTCTHYGAALAEGWVSNGEIHCPWHHACFSLHTGAALKAPAFAPLARWRVETVGDTIFVRGKVDGIAAKTVDSDSSTHPRRIVIIGGGGAAFAATERLRGLGFNGSLTMLSADADPPCDRPNLSKDYLAGTAVEDWIPLQPDEFYRDRKIDLHLSCEVAEIDTVAREVRTGGGENFGYDALLIATGAEPVRLPLPGFDRPNVFALRSLADARAIVAAIGSAKTVALIGAGFIGMEAAGALCARGLEVHVVARDEVPMERALGREFGEFITGLHRDHGVQFHLQASPSGFDGGVLTLADGTRIVADLLIVGAGVAPRIALASAAGLAVENGILVDARLQTSVAGIYAAGDVARYRHGAELVRIEHWVHAQRQGQAAAENMLGADRVFDDVPFFWTHHYGLDIRYSGHASAWDEVRIEGMLAAQDCTARFFRKGELLAAASVGRDQQNLAIEAKLQRYTVSA